MSGATDTPVLQASGITRRYGAGATEFTAVNHVDLEVARGEVLAVLGVNGAGKTSLVEVLAGMARPNEGSVSVLGMDPWRQRAQVRTRTGIMLQEAGFAGDLTAAETLRMWHGTLTRPRPVAEALDMVGLSPRASVRVGSLSGGERRRLDLAMALLSHPEVLFLDEPTTGLDPASRETTWALVSALVSEGTAVLLTTHYLEEAEQLADRLVILAAGQIARSGTLAQITAGFPAVIRFRTPLADALPVSTLTALPHVVGTPALQRTDTVLETDDLPTTLEALLVLARTRGVHLDGLDARSASLEQAFLAVSASTTSAPVLEESR